MKTIILAAGSGTRIWPYNLRNKCSIKILNKPIIQYNIERLIKNGIKEIDVIVKDSDNNLNFLNRFDQVAIKKTRSLSTMDIIKNEYQDDPLNNTIVIYGDTIIGNSDIQKMITYAKKDICSILYDKFYQREARHAFGITLKHQLIANIYANSRNHYSEFKLAGAFTINENMRKYLFLSKGYFENVPVGTCNLNENFFEIAIQESINDGQEWLAIKAQERTFDFDWPHDIMEASFYFTNMMKKNKEKIVIGKNSFIDKNVKIKGNVEIGQNSSIKNGAIIGANVVIGNNVTIEDYAIIRNNSVISDDCYIGHLSDIEGVLLEGVKSNHHCEIYGLVGIKTDIAAGVLSGSLRFDDGYSFMDIKGTKYNFNSPFVNCTYMGNYVRTGVGNIIYPGIIIGNYSAIGPGVVVSKNIQDQKIITLKQDILIRDWNEKKYGW